MSSIAATSVCAVGTQTTSLPGWYSLGLYDPGDCASSDVKPATATKLSAASDLGRVRDRVTLDLLKLRAAAPIRGAWTPPVGVRGSDGRAGVPSPAQEAPETSSNPKQLKFGRPPADVWSRRSVRGRFPATGRLA